MTVELLKSENTLIQQGTLRCLFSLYSQDDLTMPFHSAAQFVEVLLTLQVFSVKRFSRSTTCKYRNKIMSSVMHI